MELHLQCKASSTTQKVNWTNEVRANWFALTCSGSSPRSIISSKMSWDFYVLNIGQCFERSVRSQRSMSWCFYVLNIGLHFEPTSKTSDPLTPVSMSWRSDCILNHETFENSVPRCFYVLNIGLHFELFKREAGLSWLFLCPEYRTAFWTLPFFRPVTATVLSDQIAHPQILPGPDTRPGRIQS